MVAPFSSCRLTFDFKWIGPATSQWPAGTMTRPPPALLHTAIALSRAGLQSVLLSGDAPKFVTKKSWFANRGALMRAIISGTTDQPVCGSAAKHSADVAKIAAIATR